MRSEDRIAALERARSLAAGQHGVVLSQQLRTAGLSRGQIQRLQQDGWLVSLRRGAYLIDGGRPSPWQLAVAAVLLCGPEAALSHSTAGRVHRIPGLVPASIVEVTVPSDEHRRSSDAVLHRTRTLRTRDAQVYRGVRVTTPARTLVDLAPRIPSAALPKIVDEGVISRLWKVEDLRDAVESAAGPGVAARHRLLTVLDQRGRLPAGESHLELRAIQALVPLGPFETGYQVVLDGHVYVLDVAWPDYLVGAECDGWTVRSRSRSKFDHDRRRGNALEAHGWSVAHLTASMSDDEMRAAVFRLLMAAARSA